MKQKLIFKKNDCRVCKQSKLIKVLNLGSTPLANAFLTKGQIDEPEYFFPLELYFCNNCTFLQLGHVVSPEVLFGNYVYVSSTSPVFIKHFEEMANDLIPQFLLNKNSLIIDIGSNDGVLLKPFRKKGIRVLGVEPAKHIASLARKDEIPTVDKFFSQDVAKDVVKKYGKAKVITATNVFAHIDNLDEVIKGVGLMLEDDGVFITESPYLVDFIEKRYFDLVYHEHLSYWAVKPLITLFNRFDLDVTDVEKVPVHGGSIRVFAQKKGINRSKNVERFLKLEKESGLDQTETYFNFANLVQENKIKLHAILGKIKMQRKTIAAYGASAKGNTLLNFFGIGPETLDFIIDDSPWKQGLYSPGKHIPVVAAPKLYKENPDYLLILAWNFANSIKKKLIEYKKNGGRFIIPVPVPKVS